MSELSIEVTHQDFEPAIIRQFLFTLASVGERPDHWEASVEFMALWELRAVVVQSVTAKNTGDSPEVNPPQPITIGGLPVKTMRDGRFAKLFNKSNEELGEIRIIGPEVPSFIA